MRTRVIALFRGKNAAERACAHIAKQGYALDEVSAQTLASLLDEAVPANDAEDREDAITEGGVVVSAFAESEDQAFEIERAWRKLGGSYLYR